MTPFRGYVIESFGDALQQIKLRSDLQHSPLQPSQVRIRVANAAINPIDWKLIQYGAHFLPIKPTAESPMRIGCDVSGRIIQIGSEVQRLQVGDAVFACVSDFAAIGTLAEFVDIEANCVSLKPSKMDFPEAAAAPLVALTSYQALVSHVKLQPGERVLIIGASGGCGSVGVQIAKDLGAHVIATTSSRNVEFVRSLGADQVIDYTKAKWSDVLEQHSIDVIYDGGIEPDAWNDTAQKILKQGVGRFVTIANPTGTALIESPIGATFHQFLTRGSAEDLDAVAKFVDDGKLKVPVEASFAFEDALEAFKLIKTNRVRGKLVVNMQTL